MWLTRPAAPPLLKSSSSSSLCRQPLNFHSRAGVAAFTSRRPAPPRRYCSAARGAAPLVHLPTDREEPQLVALRHTAAHVLGQAVQKLFPEAQATLGPWTEDGFYYDFANPEPFSTKDLKRIKKEMDQIIKRKLPMVREEVSAEEARARLEARGESYKLEILHSIEARGGETITVYHNGDEWWDLCAGPHVNSTGDLRPKAIALTAVSAVHWRGAAEGSPPELQRVSGVAWETAEQLVEWKRRTEEAARRDHRTIGTALDLFTIGHPLVGPGLVLWHPRGALLTGIVTDYWKEEHRKAGYEMLATPHMGKLSLWDTSGHSDFYTSSMFSRIKVPRSDAIAEVPTNNDGKDNDSEDYQLKPMNCPFHCAVYTARPRSYRDLPLRWAELGTVYRYEPSGTLYGLLRVRGFTQDDAHIYCTPSQAKDEISAVLRLTQRFLTTFGFEHYKVHLSTRPVGENATVGSDEAWEAATAALTEALDDVGLDYEVDEGEGAFYGPKIDVGVTDAIGRTWQCSTIQCDFNMPERFGLQYASADGGAAETPIMLHRAIFGSLERFIGLLIEQYAGDFPLWLAPTQLRLLPISAGDTASTEFCESVLAEATAAGLRAEVLTGGERLNKMIRNAELERIPAVAVVGSKEVEDGTLSLRGRHGVQLGSGSVAEVVRALQVVAEKRELELSVESLRLNQQ